MQTSSSSLGLFSINEKFTKGYDQIQDDVDVSKFYRDSVVLITGGTGFLGKVLIEKLLRMFSIRKIYLLIRFKNNMSIEDRLDAFFEESIFDNLRKDQPDFTKKIIPINVDFGAMDLDMSSEYKVELCNEVQIVFNIVASVKFNEKLKSALEINVLGTKKILELTMQMIHLKSFLHISTLYSNCHRKSIGEKVYSPQITYDEIIKIHRNLSNESFESIQHCLIGEMPNTYTVTKRWSENLINHLAHGIPAGIFRPPIVLSTYKHPMPGWTDNLNGPSGLVVGTARGFIHCIYGNAKKKANLVPADYCINAIIASAWDVSRRYRARMQEQSELPIYNYIYDENNLTWGKYMHLVRKGLHDPLDKPLWYFAYNIIPSKTIHRLAAFLCHTIPGYVLDFAALVMGKKRIFSKIYQKIARVVEMMSYFGLREWHFQNNNIKQLDELLKKDENYDLLQFNMATINWNEYFYYYLPGIKKFHLKEPSRNVHKSRKHYMRLYLLHKFMKTFLWTMLFLASMRQIWKFVLYFIFNF